MGQKSAFAAPDAPAKLVWLLEHHFALESAARLRQEGPNKERKGLWKMKPKKTARRLGAAATINRPFRRCALNVVVYRAPGPDDNAIEGHTRSVVARHSACRANEGIGHLTLVASDFDRLWKGVERGDALGTAFCVLAFLGPGAEQFIGRENDFIFGWNGLMDDSWGDVLLLEVIPRPHLLATMN